MTTTTTTTQAAITVTRIAAKNAQRPDETAAQYFSRLQDQKAVRDARARAKRARLTEEMRDRVAHQYVTESQDRAQGAVGKLGTDIRVNRLPEVQPQLTKDELVYRAASDITAMLSRSREIVEVIPTDHVGPQQLPDGTTAVASGIAVARAKYSRTGQDVLAGLLGRFHGGRDTGGQSRQGKFSDMDDVKLSRVLETARAYDELLSDGQVSRSQPLTAVREYSPTPGVAWHGDFASKPDTSEESPIIGRGHEAEVSLHSGYTSVRRDDRNVRVKLPHAWRIAEYETVYDGQGNAVSGPGFRCLVNRLTGYSYPLPDLISSPRTTATLAMLASWSRGSFDVARFLYSAMKPVKAETLEYSHATPFGASPVTASDSVEASGPFCRVSDALRLARPTVPALSVPEVIWYAWRPGMHPANEDVYTRPIPMFNSFITH